MKKILVVAGSLACSVSYAASPVFQPIGSSFTLGTSANPSSLSTSLANPAAPFLMVDSEAGDRFRFGIIGPGGFGYELGQVDSLQDQIDELDELLDEDVSSASQAQALQSKANDIVVALGDDANGKLMASGQVPVFPFIYKDPEYGAFTVDMSVSAVGQGKFLDDDIDIVVAGSSYTLNSNSSVYVKSGVDLNLGLGYSKDVWANEHGVLITGTKLNLHSVTLSKGMMHLASSDDDSDDAFSDSLADHEETSFGVGVDVGAIWLSKFYQVGFTASNLNEPTFEYGSLDETCSGLETSKQASCYAAREFAGEGRIALNEVHTMERQFTIDGSAFVLDRQVELAASYEMNEISDLVGDKYQWATVATSYYSSNTWIPAVRLGYKKNMAGSELSYLTMGATLFKRVNFDLAYGLETIEVDGDEMPRSLYISAGIESAF